MLKKILIAVAVLALALALVACGGEPAVTPDEPPPTPDVTEHVHTYNEEITAPTCSVAGVRKMVCECGDVQSEDALGVADHTPSVADCEKDTVCTVCDAVLVPATGHTLSEAQVITAATCTTAGKEKSTCLACGKTVETDVPATGHVAGSSITVAADGFASTCTACGQAVTLKAQAPALELKFENYEAEMANASSIGLEIFKPDRATTADFNGSKALALKGDPLYINIADPSKLCALGTFVISFDYTSTSEAAAGSMASILSILNNFYDGKNTPVAATGWGWLIKYIEDNDIIATVNTPGKFSSSNSISVPKNTTVKVQIVVSPASKSTHTFINGTYIGACTLTFTLDKVLEKNSCIRFGDGPLCGSTYDNFTISALK